MKIMLQTTLAAGLLAALCAGSFAATQPEGWRDITRYEKAAGATVPDMPFKSLVDWQALDDHSVAVWTANDKPWLVRVDTPCGAGLMHADDIAFTSQNGNVTAGTDYLKVGDQRCKVASIQPVDYRQVAQAPHAHMGRARMKAS
jgi:Family of unknown function (DUF6491)